MFLSQLPAIQDSLHQAAASIAVTTTAISSTSMWALFWRAELIVKLVIVGLIIASFWSWTIIIEKTRRLKKLNAAADDFEEMFWASGSLESFYDRVQNKQNHPLVMMFCAAIREWKHATSKGVRTTSSSPQWNLEQRIDRVMQLVLNREMVNVEKHSGFLASLGSNGMIVGLFGTVLGIMHSFQSIAMQQNTNLAVVAPGIAEALFATAIGLIAAIPAAIAYNAISADINRYANRLDAFSDEFNAIVSRQLEDQN